MAHYADRMAEARTALEEVMTQAVSAEAEARKSRAAQPQRDEWRTVQKALDAKLAAATTVLRAARGEGGKKGKGGYWATANRSPNPIPPRNWGAAGDWRCPSCQGFNFAARDSCYFCQKPKKSS
mgnify:CR=1 FL=1